MISPKTYHYIRKTLPWSLRKQLMKCKQPIIHHKEGCVYNHTLLVLDQAVKNNDEELYEACVWHDIGKIYTRKEIEDGKVIFYGHEEVSCKVYDKLTDWLYTFDKRLISPTTVIANHMRAHLYKNGKMSNPNKRKKLEDNPYFKEIMRFAEYDEKGRDIGQHILITIGISGSGKSTWVKEQSNFYAIFCPDLIRKEMTGNVSDQSKNKEVWEETYRLMEYALKDGKNVLLDSTMVNTKSRRQLLDFARERNVDVMYKFFYVSPAVAKERVNNDIASGVDRSATPNEIIDRQYKMFKQTLIDCREENFLVKE